MARERTNIQKFEENPFLKDVTETTKIGKRKVFGDTKDKFMITNTTTGESVPVPAGIYFNREVDKSEFVKLYAEGAAAIMGLKSPGKKVFQIMYGKLLGEEGKDKTEIVLNYDLLDGEIKKWISRPTFFRGITELLKARFLAQTYMAGYYFINPCFIYNGNRLLIAKAYTIKDENEPFNIKQLVKGKGRKTKEKIDEETNLFEKIEQIEQIEQ